MITSTYMDLVCKNLIIDTILSGQIKVLPTSPIILKHLHRHRMPEPPDHLDRPVALVTHHIHRPQIGKRHRDIVAPFLVAGKDQNRVTPLLMVNHVLPIGVMLGGICLPLLRLKWYALAWSLVLSVS